MRFSLNFLCQKSYVQGQYVGKIREYFYYISHEGMLFLDNSRMKNFTAAYKDVQFLNFFYKQLRTNEYGRYEEFPYVSLCGRERNYVRCDDRPMVYTELSKDRQRLRLGQSELYEEFKPETLFMKPNGRLYHSAKFADPALVKSRLADELFPLFKFDTSGYPTHINWEGKQIELINGRGV